MPNDEPNFLVGVSFLVVPDGIRMAGKDQLCRLSLAVAPCVDATFEGAPMVDIREWPGAVAKLSRNLRIALGSIEGLDRPLDTRLVKNPQYIRQVIQPDIVRDREFESAAPEIESSATRLWKQIFTGRWGRDAGFRALIDVLKAQAAVPEPEAQPVGNYFGNYQGADIGKTLDNIYAAAAATTFLQRLALLAMEATPETKATSAGVAHDSSKPGVMWWQMLYSQWVGVTPLQDPVSNVAANVPNALRAVPPKPGKIHALLSRIYNTMRSAARHFSVKGPSQEHREARTTQVIKGLAQAGDFFADQIGNVEFWQNGGVNPNTAGPQPESAEPHVEQDLLGGTGGALEYAIDRLFEKSADNDGELEAANILMAEIARFCHCWGLLSDVVKPGSVADPAAEELSTAARKYASILSYPTLAKFLGLIVDIEVDASLISTSEVGVRSYGALAVDVPSGDISNWPPCTATHHGWTAFILRKHDQNGKGGYFGPCDRTEIITHNVDPNQPFKDGLLNLNVQIGEDRHARFVLETLDVTNATFSVKQRSAEISEADAKGTPQSQQATQLPQQQARGIALFDRDREHDEINRAQHERDKCPLGDPQKHCIRYAEDLVLGYRIDAALTTKNLKWPESSRWRTLVARTVDYDTHDVHKKFLKANAIRSLRERDDGYVCPMTGQVKLKDEKGETKTQNTPHSELFAWVGESLAIPALGGDNKISCRTTWINPNCDLPVSIDLDLPKLEKSRDRRPLPLRDGRGYMFGARLYLVNGCGLTLQEAVPVYVANVLDVTLGKDHKTPFVYRRREQIQAPDVLLPWNERLVLAQSREEVPGENIDYLVVRSGGVETCSAKRFVIPPRVPFQLAEQHGVYDNLDDTHGAFSGDSKALLDPVTGTFPVARYGSWELPSIKSTSRGKAAKVTAKETSRGSVLVLDDSADPSLQQFYPDPLARRIKARFAHNGQSALGYDFAPDPLEFWSRTELPRDSRPILLELRNGKYGTKKSLRGWFDMADRFENVRPRNSAKTLTLNKLCVTLAPAEIVDLEIWADPDPGLLLQTHQSIVRALTLMREKNIADKADSLGLVPKEQSKAFETLVDGLLGNDPKSQEEVLEALLAWEAIAQITGKRVLRLIHAVDRPRKPHFVTEPTGDLRLAAILISVTQGKQVAPQKEKGTESPSAVAPQEPPSDSWTKYVADKEQKGIKPIAWPSEAGGETTFFVGEVVVDRPSTSRVRCEAAWLEYGKDTIRFDSAKKRWIDGPSHSLAQLFGIDNLLNDDFSRELNVSLLRDDNAPSALRALSYSFANGKARHLTLRLIATSRFTDFFAKETKSQVALRVKTGVGRYETPTEPLDKSSAKIWVNCTFRPPQPEIDRILPVFHWSNSVNDYGNELAFARSVSLRVFLVSPTKSPWYASGEGEMLGLVCWPHDLASKNPTTEAIAAEEVRRLTLCLDSQDNGNGMRKPGPYDDDLRRLSPYEQYITRWGTDPIHLSGQLEDFISVDRFSGYNNKASDLLLTIEQPSEDTSEMKPELKPMPVSVLAYRPHLDELDGSFYCDIAVDHGAAYFPFLQLGLVRYQPHAVAGLELSRPVPFWAQIPPKREGRLIFKDDRNLVLELHGIGYHRSETGPEFEAKRNLTDFPLLNVRVMQVATYGRVPSPANGKVSWKPVLDASGKPLELLQLIPIQRGAEVWWICAIKLPRSRKQVRYGILVEEVELMAADKVTDLKSAQSCADLKFPTELVERGPLFSHILDVGG
jgi:hypothetical protein